MKINTNLLGWGRVPQSAALDVLSRPSGAGEDGGGGDFGGGDFGGGVDSFTPATTAVDPLPAVPVGEVQQAALPPVPQVDPLPAVPVGEVQQAALPPVPQVDPLPAVPVGEVQQAALPPVQGDVQPDAVAPGQPPEQAAAPAADATAPTEAFREAAQRLGVMDENGKLIEAARDAKWPDGTPAVPVATEQAAHPMGEQQTAAYDALRWGDPKLAEQEATSVQRVPAQDGTTATTYNFADGSKIFDDGKGNVSSIPATEQQRQFATDKLADRMGITPEEAGQKLDRMRAIFGPGADRMMAEAMATGKMAIGMAGISGAFGGARTPAGLEGLRGDMGKLFGRELGGVIDNSNGGWQAKSADVNTLQKPQIDEVLKFARDAGIRPDIAVHSNGINALAASLKENPTVLGDVKLLDVNISGNAKQATQDLKTVVDAARRGGGEVTATATLSDWALGLSNAANPIRGLIPNAAAAGVDHIRIIPGSEHPVDALRKALEAEGPTGPLDFRRDPNTGVVGPVNPGAWQKLGYTYDNGRFQYNPFAGIVERNRRVPIRP